jgi:hypothetical protein
VSAATEELAKFIGEAIGCLSVKARWIVVAASLATAGIVYLLSLPRFSPEWLKYVAIGPLVPALLIAMVEFIRLDQQYSRGAEQPTETKLTAVSNDLLQVAEGLERIRATMPELEAEVNLKTVAIERLQAEGERLDRLAELKKVETSAIEEVIRTAQMASNKPARRRELVYLLIGLLFSLPLGVLVNFIYDGVT